MQEGLLSTLHSKIPFHIWAKMKRVCQIKENSRLQLTFFEHVATTFHRGSSSEIWDDTDTGHKYHTTHYDISST